MNRKIWKALGIAVCMLALAAPRAMAELREYLVSNNEHFADAVGRINNESNIGDENEIVLMQDITLEGDYILTNGKKTTIKGNNHTLRGGYNATIAVSGEKTVLNLGAQDYKGTLTIDGDENAPTGPFVDISNGATANMYENVTLQNRQQVDQACVVLEENSVFNMHGGVIQNCKGKYGGVSLKNGSRFIMEGGTISECSANAGGGLYADNSIVTINKGTISGCSAYAGGGLYADNSAVTINKGTISECSADKGGGLYAKNSSTVTISGGTISGCTAVDSGGGLYADKSTINISGGTISGCDGRWGGGLYADNSTVTISGGTISGCEGRWGGGLYAENSSTIEISGGTISGCKVGAGGGLFVDSSTIRISGGIISECTTSDTGNGGGLYAKNSTIKITGGRIENNKAAHGGGVALIGDTTFEDSITNWTVISNEAYATGGVGGGIKLENGSMDVSAGSNRIYNNTAGGQGADIFLLGSSTIRLPNAANMGAKYHDSGINIDNWYNDNPRYTPSESGQVVEANKLLNGGLSLVASYKTSPVRIEIDANGGEGGSVSQTVQKGTNVTLEAPTKEGHLFKGWKDEKGNSYPAGEDGKVNITATGDMTLTAVWEARTFTVTYVLLDGKTRTETAAYGQNVTLGEEPRTGYTFVGWKDGEKVYHAGETITVTGDMTLTAEWKKLPSAENLPKTGDESPVLLWGAALAVSAAACFMLRRRK